MPDGDKLVKEYDFIIMTRPNYEIEKEYLPDKYSIINTNIDGSSTNIRSRISNFCKKITKGVQEYNKNRKKYLAINGLTTYSVITYIIENKLYMDEGCHKCIMAFAEEKKLLEPRRARSNAYELPKIELPKEAKYPKSDTVDFPKMEKQKETKSNKNIKLNN